MLFLALGALILLAFLAGLRGFERASIRTVKMLLAWVAALAGLSLALLLILTGRAGGALAALTLLGPMLWQRFGQPAAFAAFGAGADPRRGGGTRRPGPREPMTREEAYAILGLRPGAAEAEIREAHRRLMQAAHPDRGGSDWLAARINAARDVLLG